MPEPRPVIEAIGIDKSFPGQQALESVDFSVLPGEIHALVGANGSGKSTLIKILAGYHSPDAGEVLVEGRPVHNLNPTRSYQLGLRFIHQDPGVFGSLTVGENLALGTHFARSAALRVRWGTERLAARQALADLGIAVNVDALSSDLSSGQRTLLAVARALLTRGGDVVRLLVLDEPTAALPQREVDHLFEVVRSVANRGVGVVFVSHRLEEVFRIAARATVLRDGRRVATRQTADIDERQLVGLITGTVLERERKEVAGTAAVGRPPRLTVEGLSAGHLRSVTFQAAAGEIVGIAGLLGSGRSTLAKALYGAIRIDQGRIRVDDREVRPETPGRAIEAGMMLVPEDKAQQSLFRGLRVRENVSISRLADFMVAGCVLPSIERRGIRPVLEEFDVRPRDPERRLGLMSGGNQQKVVLARWMRLSPKVLILDEPTQGIDVGAKREVHTLVHRMAAQGTTILLISSDFEELALVADRVLVLRGHRLVGEVGGTDMSESSIAALAYLAPQASPDVPAATAV